MSRQIDHGALAAQTGETLDVTESDPYRLACHAAGIGVWDWDLLSDTIALSARARQIQGFPAESPVTTAMMRSLVHPDDVAAIHAASNRAMDPAIRSRETYLYRIRRADTGELRWVRAHGVAHFATVEGAIRAVFYNGSIEDITEMEQTRLALVESNARLRVALDAARMAVWELDLQSDTITSSPELNRLFGFPEEATPAASAFRALYAKGEAERLAQAGAEARARGETQLQTRVRYALANGEERVFMLRAALAPSDPSGRERAIGVVFDVTEQVQQEKRLETAARELMHRLKNMMAVAGVIAGRIWPHDERYEAFLGRLRAMSAAADLMFGGERRIHPVPTVVEHVLAPFAGEADRFETEGPNLAVPETALSGLAMALHELATNAVKHGALSVPNGRVAVTWHLSANGTLELRWKERGGPPVAPPEREGFGTQLLRHGALSPPHKVEVAYPMGGVEALIRIVCSKTES